MRNLLRFFREFLHIVFAEIPQAKVMRFEDSGGRKNLGDGDQSNFVPVPACSLTRNLDSIFHLPETFFQHEPRF